MSSHDLGNNFSKSGSATDVLGSDASDVDSLLDLQELDRLERCGAQFAAVECDGSLNTGVATATNKAGTVTSSLADQCSLTSTLSGDPPFVRSVSAGLANQAQAALTLDTVGTPSSSDKMCASANNLQATNTSGSALSNPRNEPDFKTVLSKSAKRRLMRAKAKQASEQRPIATSGTGQVPLAGGFKRSRSDDSAEGNKAPSSKKAHTVDNCLNVAIVDNGALDGKISEERYALLQAKLLAEVDATILSGLPVPKFIGSRLVDGYFRFTCLDQFTLDWLNSKVIALNLLWDTARLEVINKSELLQRTRVLVTIPGPILDKEIILRRLGAQNQELKTSSWKVWHQEVKEGKGQFFVFGVDKESLQALEAMQFRPFFGLGRLLFHVPKLSSAAGKDAASSRTTQTK